MWRRIILPRQAHIAETPEIDAIRVTLAQPVPEAREPRRLLRESGLMECPRFIPIKRMDAGLSCWNL